MATEIFMRAATFRTPMPRKIRIYFSIGMYVQYINVF